MKFDKNGIAIPIKERRFELPFPYEPNWMDIANEQRMQTRMDFVWKLKK